VGLGRDAPEAGVTAAALRRPVPARALCVVAGLAAFVAASAAWLDLDLRSLVSSDTIGALRTTVGRLFPPDLSPENLDRVAHGAVETLCMSVVGTTLGACIGLVLMPFCCESLLARGALVDEDGRSPGRHAAALAVHHAARLTANVLRTVPYFVWAVLFWFMVGPGTFTGALAIAIHTGGVIARNYAQVLDQVDLRPCQALRAAGSRRTHVFLFGMLPSARAALASFTLYRWEVNLRESTVLGLVGAGGLGFHLSYAIGIFDWNRAATHLFAIMALVLAVDALSSYVRKRLL
jgi:phosphonate transport system permease protein